MERKRILRHYSPSRFGVYLKRFIRIWASGRGGGEVFDVVICVRHIVCLMARHHSENLSGSSRFYCDDVLNGNRCCFDILMSIEFSLRLQDTPRVPMYASCAFNII